MEVRAQNLEGIPELFKAYGVLEERLLEQVKLRGGSIVTSLLGDKNEVWLGKPEAIDLISVLRSDKEGVPPIIAAQMDEFDFVLVQFASSFRPAPQCEFIRATVRVLLGLKSATRSEMAVAYDMFPREIETPITVKRNYGFSPEMKFKFAEVVDVGISGVQSGNATEYIVYEPQITTFALGERAPGWDFNKVKARPIRGSKEMFLIVKKPKGKSLYARFELAATLQTNIGRIPLSTFFLSGGDKPLIKESYFICN